MSLDGTSRNCGKQLKLGVILECLLTKAHNPNPIKFWGQKRRFFTVFATLGHKRQCATVVVRNIDNTKQYRQGTMMFCEEINCGVTAKCYGDRRVSLDVLMANHLSIFSNGQSYKLYIWGCVDDVTY